MQETTNGPTHSGVSFVENWGWLVCSHTNLHTHIIYLFKNKNASQYLNCSKQQMTGSLFLLVLVSNSN